ncbi:MAG: polyprenyl synthetase family protein [Alphaproteobacteria bacterium]|nr:polyprenyl synthetase family protein [Alphaproteobacteria bacterium]
MASDQITSPNASLQQGAKTRASLEHLRALVADDLQKVDALIIERAESDIALIPQLARYVIAAGGKRLRPAMTLLCARMCGHEGNRHIALAAAVEFIHTATLLHDDVVDESTMRRGLATANDVWGNKASVLVGDFLLSKAFQVMVSDGSLAVLETLSDASAVIAQGEVLQLLTANDANTSEAQYFEVITSKTATLFSAACKIGAEVCETPQYIEPLRQFGLNLGIAFQLVDDALDYSSQQMTLGKTIGDDLREGKVTFPVIVAYQNASEDEKVFWQRVMLAEDQQPDDLERAIALMHKHDALQATNLRAKKYCNNAREALQIFPESAEKSALLETVSFCVERLY